MVGSTRQTSGLNCVTGVEVDLSEMYMYVVFETFTFPCIVNVVPQ